MKKIISLFILFNLVCFASHSQIINTVAGKYLAPGYSGDGGPSTNAELHDAMGVATDAAGNVYIVDNGNERIRKVNANGIITTIAGNGYSYGGFTGDGGPATAAELYGPWGIAVDSIGDVYFSDLDNYRVRMVNTNGIINTVAGNGVSAYSGDGGPAIDAELSSPLGIALDKSGTLYIADGNVNRVRRVKGGIISTICGNGVQNYTGSGGPASAAELGEPYGVAVDPAGNIYIVQDDVPYTCKINTSGILTTFAGNGYTFNYSGNGGPATDAEIGAIAVASDNLGNIYLSDYYHNCVWQVNTNGIINTVAGHGDSVPGNGGPATSALLSDPVGLALDNIGNLYIADDGFSMVRVVYMEDGFDSISGYTYSDNNHDCIYNAGDTPIPNITMQAVFRKHIVRYAVSNNSGLYTFYGLNSKDTFNIEIDSAANNEGYIVTCPISGIITDTANSMSNNMALQCNGGFDLGGTLGVCVYDSIHSSYAIISACLYNYRCKPENSMLKLVLDSAMHYQYAYADTLPIISGDTLIWKFGSLGPNSLANTCVYVAAKIDSLSPNDSIPVTLIAYPIAGDSVPGNNIITLWLKPSLTYCSGYPYDPNGKTVSPADSISANQPLTYNIHFQNTGTSTATTVVVMDTLNPFVDITTLHIISSSSSMTTQLINGSVLKFIFANINLVDTAVSKTKSIGQLSYSINPIDSVKTGTTIRNFADIYFDNNPAIRTDTTHNIIIEAKTITNASQIIFPPQHILCFPNPFHNSTSVVVSSEGKHYLELDDITGRKLKWIEYTGKQYELSSIGLAPGMYFVRVFDSYNALVGMSKIIVQ